MRIMGLDYGSKTVGVAISDEMLLTAQPIETITRARETKLRQTLARIEELMEEYDVEKISIKVYGNQCKYFRSLPLHHSQKESETHSNYSIFNYRLRPTYDFCQAILSHGDFVEVLKPQWFRIQIGATIQKMHQLYE